MKNMKSGSCGHDGKGKGKRYVEIEIKMGKMPKKAAKKAAKRK